MKVSFTRHAVSRYRERVKPHFTDDQARAELKSLVKLANGFGDCPLPDHENSDVFMEIAPGIWLGLAQEGDRFVALTCITNSGFSEKQRADRNSYKAKLRQRKHFRNRNHHHPEHRPDQGWAA